MYGGKGLGSKMTTKPWNYVLTWDIVAAERPCAIEFGAVLLVNFYSSAYPYVSAISWIVL